MQDFEVSILLPVRGRTEYATRTLPILQGLKEQGLPLEVIVIEADTAPKYAEICHRYGLTYHFEETSGGFHKSRWLNAALEVSSGDIVVPYDIDLFPIKNSFARHISISRELGASAVVAGYRLMFPFDPWPPSPPSDYEAAISSENRPSALFKALTKGERFGVLPMLHRSRLIEIGGWDEQFSGWGAEDQDLLERYLENRLAFLLAPEAVYGHLDHDHEPDWKNSLNLDRNRRHYYSKRSKLLEP